ncbi:MAG: DNA-binding protein [Sphingobacteriaceae bacterium]|nr:MAG: DNA-binding protein [Sphingobacteriaceae bacterium]
MLSENPFEVILSKLEHLQSTINELATKIVLGEVPKPEVEPDRIIDLIEAARLIKKPVATARYYIHHRGLPAKKVGKSFIIRYSDLFTWLETFNEEGQDIKNVAIEQMMQNRKKFAKK